MMRAIMLAMSIMAAACGDNTQAQPEFIARELACQEQAAARCEWLDGCLNGGIDAGCIDGMAAWCLERQPELVPLVDHEACIESLETAECPAVGAYPFTVECDES